LLPELLLFLEELPPLLLLPEELGPELFLVPVEELFEELLLLL
jgi:hypothetical protein